MVQYYKMGRLLFGCWDKITVFENGREKVALKITMFEKRSLFTFEQLFCTFSAVCLHFQLFVYFLKDCFSFWKITIQDNFHAKMRLFCSFSTIVTNTWILNETGHNWVAILYFFLYLGLLLLLSIITHLVLYLYSSLLGLLCELRCWWIEPFKFGEETEKNPRKATFAASPKKKRSSWA